MTLTSLRPRATTRAGMSWRSRPAQADQDAAPPPPRRRGWFTLRRRMAAIGLLGVLFALLIAQTAMTSLRDVHRTNRALTEIGLAQRYHQDADMMHDALRADVYNALLIGLGSSSEPADEALAELDRHLAKMTQDLDRVHVLRIEGDAGRAVAGLRSALVAYAAQARPLATLALRRPHAVGAPLDRFEERFHELEGPQATETAALATIADETKNRAEAAEGSAQRRILLASLGALLGLLGLAIMLDRMGKNVAMLMARERSVAETLQASLLPERLPDLEGLDLAARYLPGGEGVDVGGDWYDVIALPTGEVGLVMGDVVGHDVKAASVMGQLRNALRAYALDGLTPAATLARLDLLMRQTGTTTLATCVYAVYDPQASTLLLANAGHHPPLLVGPEGDAVYLEQGACPPVGALGSAVLTQKLYHLAPGSTLLLYTDGLVERRGESIDVGLARLLACVSEASGDVDGICDAVLRRSFADSPPADDVALLAMRASHPLTGQLHLTLPAAPSELAPLRRTLARWLGEAAATPQETYELSVACCEAASNAIEHAYGPGSADIDVELALHGREVRMTVSDHGSWRAPRGENRGRGLELIREFTDTMTLARSPRGTSISMHRTLTELPSLADLDWPR